MRGLARTSLRMGHGQRFSYAGHVRLSNAVCLPEFSFLLRRALYYALPAPRMLREMFCAEGFFLLPSVFCFAGECCVCGLP